VADRSDIVRKPFPLVKRKLPHSIASACARRPEDTHASSNPHSRILQICHFYRLTPAFIVLFMADICALGVFGHVSSTVEGGLALLHGVIIAAAGLPAARLHNRNDQQCTDD
jgi:hypothetical protein